MFKKYEIQVGANPGSVWPVTVYVHSKATRRGFMHRAICIGCLPKDDPSTYGSDEHRARRHRVSYSNRTWEEWSGQTCLKELWDKIRKCKALDASRIPENPFADGKKEPKHENLIEPDEIFWDP